jgi:hypothetical protein
MSYESPRLAVGCPKGGIDAAVQVSGGNQPRAVNATNKRQVNGRKRPFA